MICKLKHGRPFTAVLVNGRYDVANPTTGHDRALHMDTVTRTHPS